MRTTVTLDADVVELVKSHARRSGRSFKAAINDAIRAGLVAERGGPRPYRVPSRPMQLRPGVDLTRALRLADALEDEEILRKLDLRK
ncbi:MAG: CopG family transcriptional regulator [bacterium]